MYRGTPRGVYELANIILRRMKKQRLRNTGCLTNIQVDDFIL
jgi:hypothetical protein